MAQTAEPAVRPRRVVVVTGASAGVGRATARAFAAPGVCLALLARGLDGLEAAAREVLGAGGQALILPTDVSDPVQVDAAADAVVEAYGRIDVWVNCAMVSVLAPIHQTTAAEFRRVTDVTYLGYVHGTLAALRHMRARGEGVIVQVGSALAYRAIPLQAAYCAAKHAIKGFSEALRCELLHENSRIHVTQVHLPALDTPQFGWMRTKMPGKPRPLGKVFAPEVAADAIVWASKHPRRELWVGGPTVRAMWGERLVPWYADRKLARQAWEGQLQPAAADPHRRDNLDEPVPGDHGASGRFGKEAEQRSPMLWAATHKPTLGAAAALLVGLVAWLVVA